MSLCSGPLTVSNHFVSGLVIVIVLSLSFFSPPVLLLFIFIFSIFFFVFFFTSLVWNSESPLLFEDLISYSFQVARGMEFLATRKVK